MAERTNYLDIIQAINQQAENFAQAVLGIPPHYRYHGEIRFYKDGKLRVKTSGLNAGKWTNFADGTYGDMLDLYMIHTGASWQEAIRFAKYFLGDTETDGISRSPPERKANASLGNITTQDNQAKRLYVAQKIWESARSLYPEARLYLEGRGITLALPNHIIRAKHIPVSDLPKLGLDPHECNYKPLDAIVLAATNAEGTLTAVQQIFTQAGKKAPISNVKRTNGILAGSAVQLKPAGPTLILAEGPETGMSIQQSIDIPTWITLGASNFLSAPVPQDTKEILIAVDLEESGNGLAASLKAADYWIQHGKKAGLLMPADPLCSHNIDFNDLLQEEGESSVAARLTTPWYSKHPEKGKTRAIIATCPRNLLAIWMACGGRPILARINSSPKILPHLHIPEDVTEIILAAPAENIPSLDDFLRKKTHVNIRLVEAPPRKLLDIFHTHGSCALQRLVENNASFYGQLSFYRQDLISLYPEAEILLCQSRRSADAITPSEKRIAIAWNSNLTCSKYPWHILKKRRVIIISAHSPAGYLAAAKSTQALQEQEIQPLILPWSTSAAGTLQPSHTGELIPRSFPLPKGYDIEHAIADGWNKDKLDYLLSQAILLYNTTQ